MSDDEREIADWLNTDIGFGGLNDARLEDAAKADAAESEDGEGEAPEPASEVQAAPVQAEPTGQAAPVSEPVSGDPEVILTADGKHALPFSVLRQVRAEKAELEQRLAQMQAQFQAQAQAQGPVAAPLGTQAESDDGETGAVDWQQVLSDAQADGDREMVRAARAALADRERLERIEARLQAQDQEAEAGRAQAVAAAVQAHPDLALWAGDESLLARAQEVERSLLQMPGSALVQARDWPSYFDALARATAAAYPDMPRATPVAPKPTEPPARRAPVQAAAEPMPGSISDIPGGIEPGSAIRTAEDLLRMPRADQVAHLTKLRESGRLFDFLDSLPMGAFNTGRE